MAYQLIKRTLALGVVTCLAGLTPLTPLSENSGNAIAAEFTREGRQVFVRNCVSRVSRRVSETQARQYCQCVINGFSLDHISNSEVRTFIAHSDDSDRWSADVKTIIRSCIQEHL